MRAIRGEPSRVVVQRAIRAGEPALIELQADEFPRESRSRSRDPTPHRRPGPWADRTRTHLHARDRLGDRWSVRCLVDRAARRRACPRRSDRPVPCTPCRRRRSAACSRLRSAGGPSPDFRRGSRRRSSSSSHPKGSPRASSTCRTRTRRGHRKATRCDRSTRRGSRKRSPAPPRGMPSTASTRRDDDEPPPTTPHRRSISRARYRHRRALARPLAPHRDLA